MLNEETTSTYHRARRFPREMEYPPTRLASRGPCRVVNDGVRKQFIVLRRGCIEPLVDVDLGPFRNIDAVEHCMLAIECPCVVAEQ